MPTRAHRPACSCCRLTERDLGHTAPQQIPRWQAHLEEGGLRWKPTSGSGRSWPVPATTAGSRSAASPTTSRVAPETVRRDLRELVERGVLQRVHGGAYPVESAGFESDITHRSSSMIAEKRRIAAAAAERLDGAETVYIDEGVTPQLVAEAIAATATGSSSPWSPPRCSPPAPSPTSPHVTVLLLGGRVRGRTLATVDHWAAADAQRAGHRPGLPRRQRHLPRARPDHPRPGRRRGQGAGRRQRRAAAIFVGVHTKFGVSQLLPLRRDLRLRGRWSPTPGSAPREAHRYRVLGPQVVRA